MGLTSKLLDNQTDDNDLPQVKVNTGADFNKIMPCFSDSGNDSPGLRNDIIVSTSTVKAGGQAACGSIDPKSLDNLKAAPGEKRIYSRDLAGDVIAEIWLKDDGAIVIENDNGTIELESSGNVLINGVEVDVSKNISAVEMLAAVIGDFSASLKVGTLQVLAHTHTSTTPGNPTGPMIGGPPV